MIPNIGPLEVLIVLIICLAVFGTRKLPELGASAGRTLREFRGSLGGPAGDGPTQEEAETEPSVNRAEP